MRPKKRKDHKRADQRHRDRYERIRDRMQAKRKRATLPAGNGKPGEL